MVLKTFDPKKADTIFSEEGEVCDFDNKMLSKLSNFILKNKCNLCFERSKNNIIIIKPIFIVYFKIHFINKNSVLCLRKLVLDAQINFGTPKNSQISVKNVPI